MKSLPILIAAGLLALVPLSASARIERVVEKTFNVQPGGRLHVETSGGSIQVLSAEAPVVNVVARQRIKAGSEQEADDLLKNLTLMIEQESEGVSATAKYEKRGWGAQPVQVDFVVTVPAHYDVEVRTSGGGVKIGDLAGRVRAQTSGGAIALGRIEGDVDAHTSGGNIALEEGAGEVQLGTSGGSIRVGRAVGRTNLETSGGSIDIQSVESPVQAETSGGSVSAVIKGPMKGDCALSTSGGRVHAVVDRAAAFQLDASTSGGSVRADGLTITIDKGGVGRSRLAGKVNGGGSQLRLRSSGGDILIETR